MRRRVWSESLSYWQYCQGKWSFSQDGTTDPAEISQTLDLHENLIGFEQDAEGKDVFPNLSQYRDGDCHGRIELGKRLDKAD